MEEEIDNKTIFISGAWGSYYVGVKETNALPKPRNIIMTSPIPIQGALIT